MAITVAYALDALGNVVLTLTETAFGSVDGASNLDTAGYVPFISSAGVLTINKTTTRQIFWDNTLFRFGIGTITPGAALQVNGTIIAGGLTAIDVGRVQLTKGTASACGYIAWHLPTTGNRLGYIGDSTTDVQLNLENSAKFIISGGPLVTPTATPATEGAAGVVGQWAWDTGFLYVCTTTNHWKRVAIATW